MLEETSSAPAFIRLKLPEGEEGVRYAGPRKVVYSDLDGNGHVDNARFIEITADALSQRMMEHPLETLQVVLPFLGGRLGDSCGADRLCGGSKAVRRRAEGFI